MDNHKKLKTAKTFEITLNRKEAAFESINRTLERLKAGELPKEEIDRIQELFVRLVDLARDYKTDQQNFLKSRQFPPDVVQSVRIAMADLFEKFVTADEVLDYSTDKVLELLQTAFDRREWLAKISTTALVIDDTISKPVSQWSQEDETEGRRILKADAQMSSNVFAKKIGGNRERMLGLYRHITGKEKRSTRRN